MIRNSQLRTRLLLECLEDRAVPATFTVNTVLDDIVAGNGKQSLREAINRANTTPGADTIVVPAGVFKLTSGDLDITSAMTIQGAARNKTFVDGQQNDRVFDILGSAPGSIQVFLLGLTVRNGNVVGHGGGIRVGNANLVVRDATITGNRASLTGGGISNATNPGTGNVTIVRTTVGRNVAGDDGGGLSVLSSTLTVKDSTVRRNIAMATAAASAPATRR